jgi:hypothetical protein
VVSTTWETFRKCEPWCLQMAGTILDHTDAPEDLECAVLVNNLGMTSRMELGVVLNAVATHLAQVRGLNISRVYCGTYMTATDMAGFSISIMQLTPRRRGFLDAPTRVGFPWAVERGGGTGTLLAVREGGMASLVKAVSALADRGRCHCLTNVRLPHRADIFGGQVGIAGYELRR